MRFKRSKRSFPGPGRYGNRRLPDVFVVRAKYEYDLGRECFYPRKKIGKKRVGKRIMMRKYPAEHLSVIIRGKWKFGPWASKKICVRIIKSRALGRGFI